MSSEYQRREAEASEVQQQIDALVNPCGQIAATEFQKIAGLDRSSEPEWQTRRDAGESGVDI